jgi:hypothetical protein
VMCAMMHWRSMFETVTTGILWAHCSGRAHSRHYREAI